MSNYIAMEARQKADNFKEALQFLESLQNFTYPDYVKVIEIAGIEMPESEMRQQWKMSEMTIPGVESLRKTQIEVLREGIKMFEEIAQKCNDTKEEAKGNSTKRKWWQLR